jgi:hypothetical protein
MSALTPLRCGALLLVLEIGYALLAGAHAERPNAFLIGDCPYYAAAAESLFRDGDWDLHNQLPGDLKDHEGFFAVSTDNRVVPKHSVLLPILALPFYALFGVKGFLIFNLVQVFALVAGIAVLAGNTPAARLLALAGYLSTPFLAYTYNFSPDVLGAALLVWSYVCALKGRMLPCGLLAGLAVWAKVYLALLLLPLALVVVPMGWRASLRCAAATLVGVAPMLLINWHLFGAPWVTGYDRDARVTPDGFAVTDHYSRFNQPLLLGLGRLLFDGRIGLLSTAPLWFLWPAGLWFAAKQAPRAAATLALAMVLNLLFFARYDEWDATALGNRFLFPAVALGLALQAPLWERALSREREAVAPPTPRV